MNKLWLIIKREYLVRVRKKTFILATLLTPLAIILFYALIFFIPQWTNETKRIVVKDDSGIFTRPIADLRVGILTIRQKWEKMLNQAVSILTAPYLQDLYP